jgi:hypothetical protein
MARKKTAGVTLAGFKLQKMKLADLQVAEYNPRMIKDDALVGLERSLDLYGLVQPIIWNKKTGHIVGGHQRKVVLEKKGIVETEVVVVDLPLEKEKTLNIALNNEHIQGQWDYEKLSAMLKEMDTEFREMTLLPAFEIEPLVQGEWKPDAVNFDSPVEKEPESRTVVCPHCNKEFSM